MPVTICCVSGAIWYLVISVPRPALFQLIPLTEQDAFFIAPNGSAVPLMSTLEVPTSKEMTKVRGEGGRRGGAVCGVWAGGGERENEDIIEHRAKRERANQHHNDINTR